MKYIKYNILILTLITLFSCAKDNTTFTPDTEADILNYIESKNLNTQKTSSGLYYAITKEGTGEKPNEDAVVMMASEGFLLNGTKFSETNPEGIAVELNSQIPGLQEGLQLLKEGGEGTLIIPSELGFNDGVALVIEVKLIDVIDNDADIQSYLTENDLNATKTDSGLYYLIDKLGTGSKPAVNSTVTVAYKGYFLDGTVFDESSPSGIPFRLNGVIPGWTEGIQLFREGGEGTLIVPYELGYGLAGRGSIPGGAVLVFDIKLIKVN